MNPYVRFARALLISTVMVGALEALSISAAYANICGTDYQRLYAKSGGNQTFVIRRTP